MSYNTILIYGKYLEHRKYARELARNPGRVARKGFAGHESESVVTSREPRVSSGIKRQDNARRAALAFRRLVACQLDGREQPLLLTLTYGENQGDLRVGYKRFTDFIEALRYKYGKDFKYVAVPEFQKRGAVHFHALFWGLPASVRTEQRITREIDKLWQVGWVFIKQTDGDVRLSGYLSKYMHKAFTDTRLAGQKAYTGSRNLQRPISIKGVNSIDYILDDYECAQLCLQEAEYETQWLGRCNYKRYLITP